MSKRKIIESLQPEPEQVRPEQEPEQVKPAQPEPEQKQVEQPPFLRLWRG